MPHHRKSKHSDCQSQTILTPPEPYAEAITYQCTLPTEEPTITRITRPLPFAETLTENLAWASAFIDRAAHLNEDYERLQKRLHAAIDTIGNDAIEMTLLRQQLHSQIHNIEQLESKVAGQEKAKKELEQLLAKNRDMALKAEKELANKLRKTEKALRQSKTAENRLKSKLDMTILESFERELREAEHDREDHESLDSVHDALERALQEKAAIQAELDDATQQLTSTRHELSVAQEAMETCKNNCQAKEAQIAALTEQLAAANRTNAELSTTLDSTKADLASKERDAARLTESLDQANSNLEAANQAIAQKDSAIATLEAGLAGAQAERDQKIQLLQELQESTEATQKALQDKIDQLSAHDLEDHQRLQAANEAKRISDESVRDLQSKVDAATAHDAEVQARLQAEEEAKRVAEAELERVKLQLEEANKPKLPNKVALRNPIPIVGSLGGAADNYDDIVYPIVSSFPVTIFGYCSTNVYVSINGLLSLDKGNTIYSYQPLPYRSSDMPPYTLFPFWCDLYIYKDTPQGIYYEITGEAPSRSLCIEWYVSRYRDRDQYYHFMVILEEARPNYVTYKYFEALDKGTKCTIGAQGPNSVQQWSYNEAKALPGVQVTIDTNSGSVTQSTFPITN